MVAHPHHITAAYGRPPFFEFTLVLLAIACAVSSVGV